MFGLAWASIKPDQGAQKSPSKGTNERWHEACSSVTQASERGGVCLASNQPANTTTGRACVRASQVIILYKPPSVSSFPFESVTAAVREFAPPRSWTDFFKPEHSTNTKI